MVIVMSKLNRRECFCKLSGESTIVIFSIDRGSDESLSKLIGIAEVSDGGENVGYFLPEYSAGLRVLPATPALRM